MGKIFPTALFFSLASGDVPERSHQPGQMAANRFLESHIFAHTRSGGVPLGSDNCKLPARHVKYTQQVPPNVHFI